MKIISFNIFDGGRARMPKIISVIKQENPDFLAIQEANGFEKDNYKTLKELAAVLGYKYFAIALAPSGYHVASFSRYKFVAQIALTDKFRNAALQTVINQPYGKLAICNTHLSPWTESERIREIEIIEKAQKNYQYKIILGDINSLSPQDSFSDQQISKFNDYQRKKLMKDGRLCFDVISKLLKNGYLDAAWEKGAGDIKTVHKSTQEKYAHSTLLRLDYVFVSKQLKEFLHNAKVIVNPDTDQTSDHYPIMIELEK